MSEKTVILKIYVEGITEQKLFIDALHKWFRTNQFIIKADEKEAEASKKIVIEFDSKRNIEIERLSKTKASKKKKINRVLEVIKENLEDNLKNKITYPIIRVFDADGEYEKDLLEFSRFKSNLNSEIKEDFDFIIIQNDIEDVILEITNTKVKDWISNCWEEFIVCLDEKAPKAIIKPDKKRLIFTMLELLGKKTIVGERNYIDEEIFDWDNYPNSSNIATIKLKLDQYLLKYGKSNN